MKTANVVIWGLQNIEMQLRQVVATGVGLILTGVGITGFFVPGLPGTIFLIWALACFKVSSPTLESWLFNHRLFGKSLRDWDENRWMPARTKGLVITIIAVSSAASIWRIHAVWAQLLLGVLAVYGIWFILNLRTKPAHLLVPTNPKI